MHPHWRLYGEQTVAAQLDRQQLPGWLLGIGKKAVVGPGEAAVVIRDGAPQEVVTETSVLAVGVGDRLKALVGAGADVLIYYVGLAPLDVTLFLGRQTFSAQSENRVAAGRTDAREAGSAVGGHRPARGGGTAHESSWTAGAETSASATSAGVRQTGASDLTVLALSADGDVVQAACQFRLRADPENLSGIQGLFRGRSGVATWDVAALVRDELLARVLVPEVARHPAADLRANRAVAEAVESAVRAVAAPTLRQFGLLLDSFAVNWGLTEPERQAIARRRAEREEEWARFQNQRQVAELARGHEIDKARLSNLKELKAAKIAGQEDLKTLYLSAVLGRDVLRAEGELDVARIDARIREVQLQTEKGEATVRLERRRAEEELRLDTEERAFRLRQAERLGQVEAEDKELWSMVRAKVELAAVKHEQETARRRQEIDAEYRKAQADVEDRYQQRKVKLEESLARMGMMERLVSQGLSGGQADAGVLNTLLRQATEQEYATTTDEIVRARSQALAAETRVETYRSAQADERDHQATLTRLSADLMGAAKQSPAQVVTPVVPAFPVPVSTPVVPQPAPVASCPSCRQPTQAGWRACPYCGGRLAAAPGSCSGCRAALQPGWKACPACGTPAVN